MDLKENGYWVRGLAREQSKEKLKEKIVMKFLSGKPHKRRHLRGSAMV